MSILFYTKLSSVSRIRTIMDTDTGNEKRTGEVPTVQWLTYLAFDDLIVTHLNCYGFKASLQQHLRFTKGLRNPNFDFILFTAVICKARAS